MGHENGDKLRTAERRHMQETLDETEPLSFHRKKVRIQARLFTYQWLGEAQLYIVARFCICDGGISTAC